MIASGDHYLDRRREPVGVAGAIVHVLAPSTVLREHRPLVL
jgi:hypothetical protein